MTTLQNNEGKKGPKKTFAPPAQKLHSLMFESPNSPMQGMSGHVPVEAEVKPNLLVASLQKKEEKKTSTKKDPSRGQMKEGKVQASKPAKNGKAGRIVSPQHSANKQAEKKEKIKSSLTNEEFEEIVKIVLQNSYQKHLGQCLVWVQCSSANCKKWRRLHGDIDPAALPENWSCDQNTDLQYNCCTVPEEIWTGGEGEVAYASYIPGSIIWAKQYGYPWWPGMVESDPDLGEYFLFASHLDSLPSKYHVTFFGETVSRAWIPVNMLKNFQELSWELSGVKKCKNKDCSQKLRTALNMAQEAEKISVRRRINMFGFWSRYSASFSSEEKSDVMLSGNDSPNSSLENEEETPEEEEMEEQIKDTTLSSHKVHKNKTKKSKARGTARGQGGTLQKKVMKRSLGSDPTASAGKKGQAKSDLDQPRSKKKFKTPQSKDSQTSLFIDKEARIVLKSLIPPVHCGVYSMAGTEGSGPQELLPPKHDGIPSGDEVSSDLDLEQPDRDPEQKEELQ
ncbi:zinc finger CW-type PWWP domain protein 1 [Sorex fumeus]|uniref:zinc finger CW-type PWWP domain protein 1 n=1 Tax=Sorex fumeus TaxID=62283 RepID=UPI0024AD40C0|nr:zinc finger CW-type PWWP domain protein 1 [Sorex fumeus]